MKTVNDIKLKDILPDSISSDKNVSAAAEALDPQFKLIADNVEIPALWTSIDKLPSLALDHLAIQYDVSVWRDSWPINLKRSVLKTAISDKRKKGTRAAVLQAIESIGSAGSIVEWWEQTPKGTPGTFKVYATLGKMEGVLDAEMQEDLFALIDDAKPLSAHYDFILQETLKGGVGVYGCMRALTYAKI